MADNTSGMGQCPVCGGEGKMREKRIGGNTTCVNNHTCPTDQYVNDPTQQVGLEDMHVGTNEQVEVSLNAGAELDEELANAGPSHETLFGEDYTPGEVPDVREDVQVVAALEAQLNDLVYLRQDIERSHGMSRGFAMEAQRLIPGFDRNAPLGFYTEEPSATRFKVALEEVSKGVWAALVTLVAAVIAAIVKFVQWFRKRSGAGNEAKAAQASAEQAKENLAKLDKTQESVEEIAQAMRQGKIGTVGKDGQLEKMITMSSIIEDIWTDQARYERALRFLTSPTPVFHDILQRGPYSQAFRQITPSLAGISEVLRMKLRELGKVAQLDRQSFKESDKLINTHMLDIIARPVEIAYQGRRLSLTEAADKLSAIRLQLSQEPPKRQKMNFDQLVKAVIEAYRSSDVVKFFEQQQEIVEVFQDLDTVLEKLRKSVGDLSKDGSVGSNSEGVAAHIRDVIMHVANDVTGYRRLFAELTGYGSQLEHLAMQTVGFAQEVQNQLYAMARRGAIELPEGWKERSAKDRVEKISALFSAAKPT